MRGGKVDAERSNKVGHRKRKRMKANKVLEEGLIN